MKIRSRYSVLLEIFTLALLSFSLCEMNSNIVIEVLIIAFYHMGTFY